MSFSDSQSFSYDLLLLIRETIEGVNLPDDTLDVRRKDDIGYEVVYYTS